ncbi:MAG: UbiA-like polyprenyltransferase [Planctomycetota bacterium]
MDGRGGLALRLRRGRAKARTVLEMVKFSHTIFAMPFALASLLLGSPDGWPRGGVLVWVLVAMVAARNAAMAFNRLADHFLDARNPRTAARALPSGLLTRRSVTLFVVLNVAIFLGAAAMLNRLAFVLAPFVLAILLGYSYSKRFSWASHFWLGLSLALAPCGAWVAARGAIDESAAIPVVLAGAVLFWVAGFDIIYACQDIEFDRRAGLHSLPARLGVAFSLWVSTLAHLLTVGLLFLLGLLVPLGAVYYTGVGLIAAILAGEHLLVRPSDLARVNVAFFTLNGYVGVLFLLAVLADLHLGV